MTPSPLKSPPIKASSLMLLVRVVVALNVKAPIVTPPGVKMVRGLAPVLLFNVTLAPTELGTGPDQAVGSDQS